MMGGRRASRSATRGRDPQRELHRGAARTRTSRSSTAGKRGRVAHECILDTRAREAHRGHRGRRRRQAPHGLRLPRADDELPDRGHADGRADRERAEGRARSLLRGDDRRSARRSARSRAGKLPTRRQPAQARAAHRRGDRRDRVDAPVLARAGRLPRCRGRAREKFWPSVGRINNALGDRNLVLLVPADRGVRDGVGVNDRAAFIRALRFDYLGEVSTEANFRLQSWLTFYRSVRVKARELADLEAATREPSPLELAKHGVRMGRHLWLKWLSYVLLFPIKVVMPTRLWVRLIHRSTLHALALLPEAGGALGSREPRVLRPPRRSRGAPARLGQGVSRGRKRLTWRGFRSWIRTTSRGVANG